MESNAHHALKRLSRAYLRAVGCCAVASEVQSPVPKHRVDAAGWSDGPPVSDAARRRGGARTPATYIVECKASRADFLRDTRERDALLRRRASLETQRADLERSFIPEAEPHLLRSDGFLFADLESWDFCGSRLPAYREALRELARVDRAIYGDTKFCVFAAWRVADHLLIAAPRGLVHPSELPRGWGLLEFERQAIRGGESDDRPLWSLRVEPEPLQSPERRRLRLLRNIAVAGTRRGVRADPPAPRGAPTVSV